MRGCVENDDCGTKENNGYGYRLGRQTILSSNPVSTSLPFTSCVTLYKII